MASRRTLVWDTETTAKWNPKRPPLDTCQPRIVQMAAVIADQDGKIVNSINLIIKPVGYVIPEEASGIHGITTEYALAWGLPAVMVLYAFNQMVKCCDEVLAFNIEYDYNVTHAELTRHGQTLAYLESKPRLCAMLGSKDILKLPGYYGDYKWPSLDEAHKHFFGTPVDDAHDAFADLTATLRVHKEIVKWYEENQPVEVDPSIKAPGYISQTSVG